MGILVFYRSGGKRCIRLMETAGALECPNRARIFRPSGSCRFPDKLANQDPKIKHNLGKKSASTP
jgi:hypothetical protein